jgi:DNA-binding MarR family transcriptional regulator
LSSLPNTHPGARSTNSRLRGLEGLRVTVSRQDKLDPPKIANGPSEQPIDDDQLHVDLRLGLDEVAAAEVEHLRRNPRRRPTRSELIRLATKLYDARRSRDRMFQDKLFGEPGWDMLLALYCLPSRGIMLGVMSLGHAANVPPTTGLRWQKLLEGRGLIERGPHVSDSRQQLVRLTEKGKSVMSRYLIRLFYCEGPAGADPDLRIS